MISGFIKAVGPRPVNPHRAQSVKMDEICFFLNCSISEHKTKNECINCAMCDVDTFYSRAGRHSSVGSDVAWESRGTAIDPRVRHIFS